MELCLVQDGHYSICNMKLGHDGVIHQETLEDGTLWAQWRSVLPKDENNRASEYVPPDDAARQDMQWTEEEMESIYYDDQCGFHSETGKRCKLRAGHPNGPMYTFFTDFEGHVWR